MPRTLLVLFLAFIVCLLSVSANDQPRHTHEDLKALLQDSFHTGVRERQRLASLSRSKVAHNHKLLGSPASSIKNAPFPPRGTKLNRVSVDMPMLPHNVNFAETLRRQFTEQIVLNDHV